MKEQILMAVDELVSSFSYYDRKEDEDLLRGDIEGAVFRGEITVDEIVDKFRASLMAGLQ